MYHPLGWIWVETFIQIGIMTSMSVIAIMVQTAMCLMVDYMGEVGVINTMVQVATETITTGEREDLNMAVRAMDIGGLMVQDHMGALVEDSHMVHGVPMEAQEGPMEVEVVIMVVGGHMGVGWVLMEVGVDHMVVEVVLMVVQGAPMGVEEATMGVEEAIMGLEEANMGLEEVNMVLEEATMEVEEATMEVEEDTMGQEEALMGVEAVFMAVEEVMAVEEALMGVEDGIMDGMGVEINMEDGRIMEKNHHHQGEAMLEDGMATDQEIHMGTEMLAFMDMVLLLMAIKKVSVCYSNTVSISVNLIRLRSFT